MNILHTITSLNVGGAQRMLAAYLAGTQSMHHHTAVLSIMKNGDLDSNIAASSDRFFSLGLKVGDMRPDKIFAVRSAVKSITPQLIHGWMYHGNLVASIASHLTRSRPPVVWSIHHSLYDLSLEKKTTQLVIQALAKLSSSVAAISYTSEVSADQHEALGFDKSKRFVIPNGIDPSLFRTSTNARRDLRVLLNIPQEREVIGSFSRFHPMKDPATLVCAIAQLLADGFDVQGLFVGEGHETGVVRATACQLGISDRISTFGLRFDTAELMPGLDVYALSSAWGETFSLAVLEAMSSEVPSVVTNVGDCAYVVGDTGKVSPPRDPLAMAECLKAILRLSYGDRRMLGIRARQRVLDNFTLAQYIQRHAQIYKSIIEPRCNLPTAPNGILDGIETEEPH